ncbi:probable Probable alpha-glucosidase [Cephalotrichum gorgonifer]|uniref:Probable Probable alpha-glucosidase n=1 Tax=Cephalotrichum gorgonifer TaxID=2041049 RepID=A0AAE8SZN4_9PEZI|nr:probable Probable alpha-glucosidase [Cephalotrichum gorgonifer]
MSTSEVDRDWWRGAVIYQIYPRSFQDSNGDGVGDLRGMLTRLPHIARLGADAIWISPFFKSPMKDYGYDVADFTDVDPIFGTIEDFDAVVAESHRLGLKVMIDLVISHTSDEHPWFKESRSSRNKETNPRSDWYVWSDPKPDGTPPNNWLSIFGGSAWEWDSRREQYYLHNFLVSQPDLNFHNPDVQDALLTATRFWLDRGVDGFRLDTINFYFHSKGLESNPPLAPEDRNDSAAPSVNPYNYQDHIFDKNQPENLAFLARFRALLDEYPAAAAVGEVGDAQRSMELVTQYTAGTTGVHMCYLFDFLSGEKLTSARVRSIIEGFEAVGRDSWCCWALSNHDTTRVASRWASDEPDPAAHAKLVAAMLMSSRGSYCIYQGEELGLPEVDLAFEDLQDPYGIRFWPEFKGRDGCRTPVAWDSNLANAGFSEAKPWLPVPAEHVGLSVNTQEGEGNSMMEHYRRMLKFRATHPVLVKGSVEFVDTEGSLVAFKRSYGGETVLCLFNLGVEDVSFPLGELAPIELKGHGYVGVTEQGKIKLGPYQAWFGQLA